MKALGKDIRDCWDNHFPENGYIGGDEIYGEYIDPDSGDLTVEDNKVYNLRYFPYIYFEGEDREKEEVTFESVFKKYYAKYHTAETTLVTCTIPLDKESKFLDFCQKNNIGIEVL
jgi:hypothetical protein